MLTYNLWLSWLSIKQTPVLSFLMIAAIGMGIGVCMTIITVYTLMANDPIPAKSRHLYTYALDNHLKVQAGQELDDPNPFVGYRDVMNLKDSTIPVMQSIHYQTTAVYRPEGADLKPFRDRLRLATNGFFPVFDVPFRYGGPWSDAANVNREQVIVLTRELNDRLFGGGDSVGRKVDVDGRFYEVVGVMDEFSPIPRYFEADGGVFDNIEGGFVPFSLTPVLELRKSGGSIGCIQDPQGDDFRAFLNSECTWIHHWVLFANDADRDAYRQMLDNYTNDQRRYGRFQGPYRNRMFNVMEWLEFQDVINPAYIVLIGIAFMFLVVCLLNTNGLLFAKFSGRAGEISVRRALGCSKRHMFVQHLVEIGVIGFAGGMLGLGLSGIGLMALKNMFANYEHLAHLNVELVVLAIGLSVGTTLIAGLYPAWRISQLPPAAHLKLQ